MTAVSRERASARAFTLLEVMLVVAIAATLAAIAIPGYRGYVERARIASAISDIKNISTEIDLIAADEDADLPVSLAELDNGGLLDPWGRPYRYLRIDSPPGPGGGGGGPPGQPRKDRFLVPINSDYDLYSLGPDGQSVAPLTAAHSRDDIIRAADGAYIGPADRF